MILTFIIKIINFKIEVYILKLFSYNIPLNEINGKSLNKPIINKLF